jgi:hypothetical protein
VTAALSIAAAKLDPTIRVFAIIVTALMFGLVLELVRRRRLAERYALLWIAVALTLLVLAVWTDLLSYVSDLVGVKVPANFLFLAALGFSFLLLLHFSVANSRLSEETKVLAQQVARLDSELREARTGADGAEPRGGSPAPPSAASAHPAEKAEDPAPVEPEQGV